MGISRTVSLALFLTGLALPASAVTTFVTASRATRVSTGTGTDQTPRVAGGHILNATTSCNSTSELCNTCQGGTQFVACNESGINPQLKLRIEAKTDASVSSFDQNDIHLLNDQDAVVSTTNMIRQLNPNGTFSVEVPWLDLCVSAGFSDCATSFSKEFEIGIGEDEDNLTEKVKFQLVMSAVDATTPGVGTDWSLTPSYSKACEFDAANYGTTGHGFCEFFAYPGDAKIYADKPYMAQDSVVASGDIKWQAAVFFEEPELTVNEAPELVLGRIRNNTTFSTINFDNTATPVTLDARIPGLENGVRYCFLLANKDEAGNIYRAIPYGDTNHFPSTATLEKFCATPQQVLGLLDDKKCFIATAAFGSPFERHVGTLRQFRNQYLQTNAVGKEFVQIYYRFSPAIADWISESETLKSVTRTMLLPAVAVAQVATGPYSGFAGWTFVAFVFVFVGTAFYRRRSRGVK